MCYPRLRNTLPPPYVREVQGAIQNIPDWCLHLYSSCGSAKRRYVVGLSSLVSQCAKLHVGGWTWAVFTRVYLEFYDFYSVSPEKFGSTHLFVITEFWIWMGYKFGNWKRAKNFTHRNLNSRRFLLSTTTKDEAITLWPFIMRSVTAALFSTTATLICSADVSIRKA
jgi:hypothetical protein